MLAGALTGLLYGLTEYAAVILEPMLRWGPRSLGPEHWFWEPLLLLIYVFSGIAIGFVAGSSYAAQRFVTGTGVAVLFIGRQGSAGFSTAADLDLALALTAVLALRAALSTHPARELAWFSSPWITIPMVAGMVKVSGRAGGATLFCIAALTILVAIAASRVSPLHRTMSNRFVPFTAAVCAILLPLIAWLTVRSNALPLVLAGTSAAESAERPNVLLIVLDTVRADHLSLYGYAKPTTPNLAALARDSVLFRNAISAADMTLSSYGSMYTGLYPSWHGALPNPAGKVVPLDRSFVTLAETLSDNGYATGAVLANHGYLNREFGMQQGFGLYDVRPVAPSAGVSHDYWLRHALRPALNFVIRTAEWDRVYRRADQITSAAIRVLTSRKRHSAPFFLSLNYVDAHEPYLPPPPYRQLFSGNVESEEPVDGAELRQTLGAHRRTPRIEAGLHHMTAQYDRGVAYLDTEIKRLLDALKQAGLYDNTLILVTSDHGEALGERDDLGHPVSVHQELVHVPLLIKYPSSAGVPPGQETGSLASGVDVMPTILDIAGIRPPANLPGRSLRNPGGDPDRILVAESFVDSHLIRIRRRSDHGQRAVYQGKWKFIATVNGSKELYDWVADPSESHNIYNEDHPEARRLSESLDPWLDAVPRPQTSTTTMTPQTRDRLRGLGYIQ